MLKRADAIPGARVRILASKRPSSEQDLLPNEVLCFEKGPGDMVDQLTKGSVVPVGQILILTSKPRRVSDFAAMMITFKLAENTTQEYWTYWTCLYRFSEKADGV